jgi:hypothetical protein
VIRAGIEHRQHVAITPRARDLRPRDAKPGRPELTDDDAAGGRLAGRHRRADDEYDGQLERPAEPADCVVVHPLPAPVEDDMPAIDERDQLRYVRRF